MALYQEEGLVRCYACGGCGTVVGPYDFTDQRASWPRMACPFTEGCAGLLVPEALN